MDFGVMERAEQATVLVAGGSTVDPMRDVVPVAPTGFAVTPGPAAAPVPQGDRPADRGRERPGRGPDVQHLRGAVEDGGHDPGVASQHPGLTGADRAAVVQVAVPTPLR